MRPALGAKAVLLVREHLVTHLAYAVHDRVKSLIPVHRAIRVLHVPATSGSLGGEIKAE